MTNAIEVAGVSKRFRLYHEKYTSLKERVIHLGRIPYDDFWALRDIEVEIEEGTTVGLLGHNGSGKSTLLKCIVGILQPTAGEIRTRGRLAALLELGAGFHPDLTGRENVFLNASFLGISKRETERIFDDIVSFAELESFIDNQVKYYSSGMYIRLGFAVAVNLDPDILIVDEVLAVGDEAFQRKCLDRVRQFQRDGKTILFVTHAADLVRSICDKVAVLEEGKMVAWGAPGESVRTFREHLLHLQPAHDDTAGEADGAVDTEGGPAGLARATGLRITSVSFDQLQDGRTSITTGEPLTVRVRYEAKTPMPSVVASLGVFDLDGKMLFGANNYVFPAEFPPLEGRGDIVFHIPEVPLLDGTYPITVGLTSADGGTVYDWREQLYSFGVMSPYQTNGVLHLPTEISVHPADQVTAAG